MASAAEQLTDPIPEAHIDNLYLVDQYAFETSRDWVVRVTDGAGKA